MNKQQALNKLDKLIVEGKELLETFYELRKMLKRENIV